MPTSLKNIKEALTISSLVIYFLKILANLRYTLNKSLVCEKVECKIISEKERCR